MPITTKILEASSNIYDTINKNNPSNKSAYLANFSFLKKNYRKINRNMYFSLTWWCSIYFSKIVCFSSYFRHDNHNYLIKRFISLLPYPYVIIITSGWIKPLIRLRTSRLLIINLLISPLEPNIHEVTSINLAMGFVMSVYEGPTCQTRTKLRPFIIKFTKR